MEMVDAVFDKYINQRLSELTKETTEEEIKDLYKNWATKYDKDILEKAKDIFRKPVAESLDAAIKQVFQDKPQSQIKIIDAGAGTGLAALELSKLGYTNIDALDISQEMLDEAKRKNLYNKFICAPLNAERNKKIETGEYHVLISTGTLGIGHVQPEAFEEMIRMVTKGGLLCFTIHVPEVKDYKENMLELEKTGEWEIFSNENIPYSENDYLPKEISAFIFKVLKN